MAVGEGRLIERLLEDLGEALGVEVRSVSGRARRGVTGSPSAAELLETTGALLDRRALAEFGLARRLVDVIFRTLPVVALPDVRRVYVRSDDLRAYLDEHTYDGRTKIRPT